MSDERDKLNQLSEIIDVEFLPVLDDEDFKKERANGGEQSEAAAVAVPSVPRKVEEIQTPQTQAEEQSKQETVKMYNEPEYDTYTDSKVYSKSKTYTESKTHAEANAYGDPKINNHSSYQNEDHTAYQKYAHTKEQAYKDTTTDTKQDTSYASYNSAKKEEFKKKKKKIGSSLLNGIALACAILFGLPIAVTLGGTAVFVLGMGIFFSVVALGMGVIGLGMAGFTMTAGMASMGILCLFGSLIAIGVGGLGCCIIAFIFIGIKSLFVGSKQRRQLRKEREEA